MGESGVGALRSIRRSGGESLFKLIDRPLGVLGNQWFRIFDGIVKVGKVVTGSNIA